MGSAVCTTCPTDVLSRAILSRTTLGNRSCLSDSGAVVYGAHAAGSPVTGCLLLRLDNVPITKNPVQHSESVHLGSQAAVCRTRGALKCDSTRQQLLAQFCTRVPSAGRVPETRASAFFSAGGELNLHHGWLSADG